MTVNANIGMKSITPKQYADAATAKLGGIDLASVIMLVGGIALAFSGIFGK